VQEEPQEGLLKTILLFGVEKPPKICFKSFFDTELVSIHKEFIC
jgi:hypothetical protein